MPRTEQTLQSPPPSSPPSPSTTLPQLRYGRIHQRTFLLYFGNDSVETVVVRSFFGVMLSLFGGMGSVCWEVATYWIRVCFNLKDSNAI